MYTKACGGWGGRAEGGGGKCEVIKKGVIGNVGGRGGVLKMMNKLKID